MTRFPVRAEDKVRSAQYFQSRSHAYNRLVERGVLKYLRARERQAVFDLARFDDSTIQTMIDVGCGGGVYALAAKAARLHVTAVDVCPGMIEHLNGKVDTAVVGDVEALRVVGTYDVVVCSGALEYVCSPEIAVRNLCHLVAPAGRLVVQAPRAGIGGALHALLVRGSGFRINLFTVSWLAQEVKRWGLELSESFHPLPYNLVAVFRRPNPVGADEPRFVRFPEGTF